MIVGVIGAGTMGAGIAQLAAQAGLRTLLHDPDPAAVERGLANIAKRTDKPVETVALEELTGCDVVIEAAPERLEVKQELFRALSDGDVVLATNTSSLSVTAIASAVPRPDRVVGLHFFNPAPVMELVELVAGMESSPAALARAREVAEAMGKHVIEAADVAGFLVNRANRPFGLESLKLLEENAADVATIDRALRLGAGFPMGAFELMDLVGLDVGHGVAESFRAQSYGEPRYRPSPLAARQVAAGRLGRKTGRGWYAYPEGRPADPEPAAASDIGRVEVLGDEPLADELRAAVAGFTGEPWLTVTFGPHADGPRLRVVREDFLAVTDPEAAGFHAVAPLGGAIELTRTPRTDPVAWERSQALIAALGKVALPVEDVPGLITRPRRVPAGQRGGVPDRRRARDAGGRRRRARARAAPPARPRRLVGGDRPAGDRGHPGRAAPRARRGPLPRRPAAPQARRRRSRVTLTACRRRPRRNCSPSAPAASSP